MRAATSLSLLSVALTVVSVTATSQNPPNLAGIHRIYINSFGQDGSAPRFRALLSEEIGKAGFIVVTTPADADARLTGALTTRKFLHRRIHAYATVELTTSDGRQVWGGEFHEPIFRFTWSNDAVAVRARDIAKKLKTDQQALTTTGK